MRGVAGDEEGGVGVEEGQDGGEGVGRGFGGVGEVVDARDAGGGGEVGVLGLRRMCQRPAFWRKRGSSGANR